MSSVTDNLGRSSSMGAFLSLSDTFVTMTSGIWDKVLDLLDTPWSSLIFQGFAVAWGDSGRLIPESNKRLGCIYSPTYYL